MHPRPRRKKSILGKAIPAALGCLVLGGAGTVCVSLIIVGLVVFARPAPASGSIGPRVAPTTSTAPEVPGTIAGMAVSAKSDASAVPIEAVHLMVSNNLKVKECFVPMFKAKTLPPRVEVQFNISPEGKAVELVILRPETLTGSSLQQCLASNLAEVAFPTTQGNGTSIVYPFELR